MAESYLPILILMLFAIGVAGVMIFLSAVLGPRLRTRRKLDTYESGMPLVDASRKRMSIQFFLIAMVFILFDVEIAFLYPWALVFRAGGMPLFAEMVVFLAVLAVGYAYLWKKKAFDW
ncbi:MAG TPA: NADH-quinone oxidoreductase subunit A [Thermoanaerobaculia bacterium]|nr:NADH-quinone oxidoreductase subunit A [Thermoanaerobaculia bacterium]